MFMQKYSTITVRRSFNCFWWYIEGKSSANNGVRESIMKNKPQRAQNENRKEHRDTYADIGADLRGLC